MTTETPANPYPSGAGINSQREGWTAYFAGKPRAPHPFPPIRDDLGVGYRIGWDAAQAHATAEPQAAVPPRSEQSREEIARVTMPISDPDLGRIGPGHVCKHGIRWPHACDECDAALLSTAHAEGLGKEDEYGVQTHVEPQHCTGWGGQPQTAWLVEWPATKHEPVRYWHATEPRMMDPHDATWLVRREDAEAVIKRDKLFGGARPVEHIFGLTRADGCDQPRGAPLEGEP